MSDFVIYENPGNKAARLERENAQLRSENKRLRVALGESAESALASSQALSQAPALPQQQTFSHGACQVTIGAKPGSRRGGAAIPSLQQDAQEGAAQQQTQPGESEVQIFSMAGGAPSPRATTPAPPQARAPQRRIGNAGGLPGGGGSAVFDLSQLRPVPVRPANSPAQPGDAVDDARQRFALIELNELDAIETVDVGGTAQQTGEAGGTK